MYVVFLPRLSMSDARSSFTHLTYGCFYQSSGAVILPEIKVNETMIILRNMTIEERCQRRKRCYDIYTKYMITDTHVVSGIIDGLELVLSGHHKKLSGVHCLPGDDPNTTCNLVRR